MKNLIENNFYMSNTTIECILCLCETKHLLMPQLDGLGLN
jgi:hypothetical protein